MASPEEDDKDLFADQEVAAMQLEGDFNATEEWDATPNANDNDNGGGGPRLLPLPSHGGQPLKAPPGPHANLQATGVPQPTGDLKLSPFSQWQASEAIRQQRLRRPEPIYPPVQGATSHAAGVQDIPIDPALYTLGQETDSQAGGPPQPAQQQGPIDPSTQTPNQEAAPETNSSGSDGITQQFLHKNGFWNFNNLNGAEFDAIDNYNLQNQINQEPQGGPVPAAAEGDDSNPQVQPAASAVPEQQLPAQVPGQIPAFGGTDAAEQQNTFNNNHEDVRHMPNFPQVSLPESISAYLQTDQQGGPGPEVAAVDGSNHNQIQPATSAAPKQAAPVNHGGQQNTFNSEHTFGGGPVPTHGHQPTQQVPAPGANVGQGSATQQPQHEHQHFTHSEAPQGGAGGHFQTENQQLNQSGGTQSSPWGAGEQPYYENQHLAQPQNTPQGQGGYMYPDPERPQVNQFNNGEHQPYGGAQTGHGQGGTQPDQGQGGTDGQFNNGGQQQVNNGQGGGGGGGGQHNYGAQLSDNTQYGQEEASHDLLNLGAAHVGQFHDHFYQLDKAQNGQGGTGGFNNNNNTGSHQVGGAQYNNQGQQPNVPQHGQGGGGGVPYHNEGQQFNNLPSDQEVAASLLNLHNGQQQLGGAQTGYGAGGGQFNDESQQTTRANTPQVQGGVGGQFYPSTQQPAQFNHGSQQTTRANNPQVHGGMGGQYQPPVQQPNQFNNGSQQATRTNTPQVQGGMGGQLHPPIQQPDQFNNGMQHGQGAIGGQSNNGSRQTSRAPTRHGGMGGCLAPGNQQLNQNNGIQQGQGGGIGHLTPIPEDQQVVWPNVAGGGNQYPPPGNQQVYGSPFGAGGVVQPASGYQQFAGSQFGGGGQPHPGAQPQPVYGSVNPHGVQTNNGGTPDPNQPPAVGSAPPELHPSLVVTPPVFPPGTLQPERWVAPGSGNEVVKIRGTKSRNKSGGTHPHQVYYYKAHTQSWGTEYDEQGRSTTLFSYANSQPLARAELVHSKQYTASQLGLFFRGEGHPNRPNRHLTLWIQNMPLMVSDRYAQANASKCRYAGCPIPRGTITKGFHRVCLDEHSLHSGDYYDPFNNAGYMHLWCFEKAFDAGYLVWDVQERPHLYGFRIEADVRHHRFEEKNAASLNRDHNLHDTYRQWKNEQWNRYVQIRHQEAATGQRHNPFQTVVPDVPHDRCLWRRLTDRHIGDEVPARGKARALRAAAVANTIERHRGDLVMYIRGEDEKKGRTGTPAPGGRSQQGTPAPGGGGSQQGTPAPAPGSNHGTPAPGGGGPPSTPSKRKRASSAENDDPDADYVPSEDGEEEGGSPGPRPSSSAAKRTRYANAATSTPSHLLNNNSSTMPPPPLPGPGHTPPGGHQTHLNNPPSTPRRSTRRSSLALAHDLGEQLGNASESPLTRSRATFLGQQLNQLPAHLQQDVISHAPQSVQAISPLFLQNWRTENWGDVLRERVSRMTPYHQGLLVQFAEKTERRREVDGGVGKRRWRSDP